jgi:hypothetical protein
MRSAIKSPSDPMLAPAINTLIIADGFSCNAASTPVFSYVLAKVTPGDDKADPPVPEQMVNLSQGSNAMTDEQWNNWTDQPSEEYILSCVAENLGLEIIPSAAPAKTTRKKVGR